MARQTGVITLKGTIGSISFYKTRDGHLAREKGGVEASRIASDPAFQRTRENGAEFGRAGKASKLLRNAIRVQLQTAKDRRVTSRLTTEMVRVLQMDTVSERGMRNVIDGDLGLLEGFEFNANAPLSSTIYTPYVATIDRVTGNLSVSLDPYIPAQAIAAPTGTTHFKIISAGTEVDFANETFIVDSQASAILPWDNTATAALTLANAVTANSTQALFLVLGIQFYQQVNGIDYPLKNGAFNSLAMVKVDLV